MGLMARPPETMVLVIVPDRDCDIGARFNVGIRHYRVVRELHGLNRRAVIARPSAWHDPLSVALGRLGAWGLRWIRSLPTPDLPMGLGRNTPLRPALAVVRLPVDGRGTGSGNDRERLHS